ncbi:peptide ABC transporter substrate-binding protein [Simkania negevensis]|uniref:Oligopeptide-binding protein oppA n=1 Tax=Simkania negevensis (strain ATCC VR-1471 / DSM 27360 / Z) TaxID=331113 RepID=F8L840_SIMNZ|nr:peptide ABC transporter substrate-binding protein [Simkania negevensis]CCB88947.1 oligopeptide-binding protein oppA [Simkania negevensis Z]
MMKKIAILFTLLACLIVGCHSSPKKPKQMLRINFLSDPPTLDPRKGGDPTSSTVQFMLFEGLTRMSPHSSAELALATKITTSEDRTIYTFHLRETYWSDGHPVTAYDFEAAWKKMLDPTFPAPNAHLLYPIKNAKAAKEELVSLDEVGLRALDAQTFEVTLEGPTPYFLELIAFCVFFPVPSHIVETHPEWADKVSPHLVTNGPFILKEWKIHDKLILERNPSYWEARDVGLDGIHISLIESESTALQLYERGELDFLGLLTPLPLDSIQDLKQKGWLKKNPLGATTYCSFNVNHTPFTNPDIRKAFAYAINREAIVKHTTQLDEEVASGPIPSILKYHMKETFFADANEQLARYHLRKGLQELGLNKSDLSKLTFMYLEGDAPKKVAQALQQQWNKVLGIRVNLECYTFKVYLDKLFRRDYEFAFTRFVIQYNDIMNILDLYKFRDNPKNYPGWENPEYTKLLDHSMRIEDPKERIAFLRQAEQILINEMPIAPIYHWNQVYLCQPRLKGMYISPIGSIHLGNAYLEAE